MLSCGKVSQETGVDDKAIRSFDLSYRLEVYSTMNFKILTTQKEFVATKNYILTNEFPIYSSVEEYHIENGSIKHSELSWGMAILNSERVLTAVNQTPSTGNKQINPQPTASIRLVARSFDKNGVVRTASDTSWTVMNFENGRDSWIFSSKNIKLGFPRYVIKVYTNEHHYFLKLIEDTGTTDKNVNNIGSLSLYDTFIASLFLSEIQSNPKKDKLSSLKDLSNLFHIQFFNLLKYEKPFNKTEKFNPKLPEFSFDDELTKELLKIWNSYQIDKKELVNYLKSNKSEILPPDAKDALIKTIEDQLKQQ